MQQLRVAHVAVRVALVRSASGVSICTFVLVKKVNCRVVHAAVHVARVPARGRSSDPRSCCIRP
jgi:hypothetical protein